MATWVGHGIAGVAIARAAGMGPRGMALGFLIANAPDLDLVLGLAVEGDTEAFHRQWWSHSPAVAVFGALVAFGGYALAQALRRAPIDRRRGGAYALFVALLLLSHSVWDFVIINPTILLPEASTENLDEIDNLLRSTGRQLLGFLTDILFYGVASLLLYRLYLRLRRRYGERPA
ncbi:MAG: hypothetical protein ACE5KW_02125 [Dehalococcoidia bacterium]